MVTVGVCCPLLAGGNPIGDDSLPDSLLTRDHIYEYTFSDTVKAARIINTMRGRKLAPVHVLDIAQGDLLFNNGRYNAALPYYEKALRSDSVKADEAYRLWKGYTIAYTKDDYLIAPYLTDRKMYDEVIRICSSREKFLRANKDTISYHVMTIKRALGNAYFEKKDFRKAAGYFRELAVVTDT